MATFRLSYSAIGLWLAFDPALGSTGRADGSWKPLYRNWPAEWHNPRWRREISREISRQTSAISHIDPASLGFNR